MKAVVFTLGCKVNDVESGSIIRGLKDMGYDVSREIERADLYVINTCAVTAEAARKSRQAIGKALKYNAAAKVIVCGCASEKTPNDFLEKDGVFAVVGNHDRTVPETNLSWAQKGKTGYCKSCNRGLIRRLQAGRYATKTAYTRKCPCLSA